MKSKLRFRPAGSVWQGDGRLNHFCHSSSHILESKEPVWWDRYLTRSSDYQPRQTLFKNLSATECVGLGKWLKSSKYEFYHLWSRTHDAWFIKLPSGIAKCYITYLSLYTFTNLFFVFCLSIYLSTNLLYVIYLSSIYKSITHMFIYIPPINLLVYQSIIYLPSLIYWSICV